MHLGHWVPMLCTARVLQPVQHRCVDEQLCLEGAAAWDRAPMLAGKQITVLACRTNKRMAPIMPFNQRSTLPVIDAPQSSPLCSAKQAWRCTGAADPHQVGGGKGCSDPPIGACKGRRSLNSADGASLVVLWWRGVNHGLGCRGDGCVVHAACGPSADGIKDLGRYFMRARPAT